jgi:hypothetical protein
LLRSASLLFISLLATPVHAQEQPGRPPHAIEVQARKNAGNVPYRFFIDGQKRLRSYLPAEPRMLDVTYRIAFTELSIPEQDAYEPVGWSVSIVGDTVDQTVPLRRGGYFVLPEITQAYEEGATLMFREQSRRKALEVDWIVRVGPEQRMSYTDFARTMDEIHALQKTIPVYHLRVRSVKYAKYDGIKACFRDPGGTVLIDGKPAADATIGNCGVLKFDAGRATRSGTIEFSGPLDIVTVVETADYLSAPHPIQ